MPFLFRRVILIVSAAVFSAAILAQRTSAQGGPPVITDDTETVPKGHWEINTAIILERTSEGHFWGTPLLDVNYGLGERFQLKVEIPWLVQARDGHKEQGLGNTNIGVRWRFRDEREKHRIAMSIYPQFEFNNPTSSLHRGLVDHGPEFLMPLQWQTQIGKFGINGDVGYRFKRGPDEIMYGVVVGREFKERVELLAEIHATGERTHLGETEVVYNFGSRVKFSEHATLLLAAGKSFRPDRDPRFIGYAGLQVTF